MPKFGAHMSVAGGLENGVAEAKKFNCDTLQIFVKNQRQWKAAPLKDEQVKTWTQARTRAGIDPVIAHASYLINMASQDDAVWEKSFNALADEMNRCQPLNVQYLVVHPGSHGGHGEEGGIARVIEAMDRLTDECPAARTRLLLETTAGQGASLGHRFEHLAEMLTSAAKPDYFGVCLDTCHVFAAGYDIRTPDGVEKMLDEFDDVVGLQNLYCLHVNDSKRELGSRVDRHEHIGDGEIGARGIAAVIRDERLADLPMILETPKGTDKKSGKEFDAINLGKLRRYARGK